MLSHAHAAASIRTRPAPHRGGPTADCAFGPVDGHPDPGADFDDLPDEGEWDDLDL
jgi:hypothetical protein